MTRFVHRFRSRDDGRPGSSPESIAESDASMALGAAFLGTLLLGGLVGVESHWELLVLLAIVAAVALVFEAVTLQRAPAEPKHKPAAPPWKDDAGRPGSPARDAELLASERGKTGSIRDGSGPA